MKKSKLAANVFIGIAVYVVVCFLITLVILGLSILIFGDYLKTNHIASVIFTILTPVLIILMPLLSHFIYCKILNKYNTKYELSVTLKAVFITFLIFTIIIAIIFFCASGIQGLLIATIPLSDTISYLNKSNKYEMLIHNEKVEQLWAGLKPEITEKMFKKGTVQVSNIIISLSQILNVNLKNNNISQYKQILKIYTDVYTWKIENSSSIQSILFNLKECHKDYITSEDIAKKVFDFCVSDIYITNYKKECDKTSNTEELLNNEIIEQLWSDMKPETTDKIFQNDKEKIRSIIISLSQILNINLKECDIAQYKNIVNIYGKIFIWKTEKNASDNAIILSLQKYHKDYITSEDTAKKVLDFCTDNI